MRGSKWFTDYTVVSDHDELAPPFRLKILEAGTLLFLDGEAAHVTGPDRWRLVSIAPDVSLSTTDQHKRLGMGGSEWLESFFVRWADEIKWPEECEELRPTDATHRMKLLANGMLLFQRRDSGALLLAAPNAWVLAKGPWGDLTR